MIDQEGGVVSRLRSRTPFASALSLGHLQDEKLTEEYGKQTGLLLRSLGFNTNLAPVLDISSSQKENFLGHRAFGDTPEDVSAAASAIARGLSATGVLPVAKHFPGHGGLIEDSHKLLPQKNLSLEQLTDTDLKPFAHFSENFPTSGLMVAHLAFPSIDPSGVPASFSKAISSGILRQKIKYGGILLTDDLEMASAKGLGDVGERAVKAVEAGADMIMLSWNQNYQRIAFEAILNAVANGRLSEARIDESLERIRKVKKALRENTESVENSDDPKSILANINRLNGQIARHHFDHALPSLTAKLDVAAFSKVAIFSSDRRFSRSALKHLGRSRGLPTTNIQLGLSENEASAIKKTFTAKTLGLFYLTGQGSARVLRSLPKAICSRIIIVNTMYPGLIGQKSDYFDVVNLYSGYPESGEWISDLIQKSHTHPAIESAEATADHADI